MSWTTHYIMTPGWDAGARTIAQLSGDGGYTFSVGQCIGIVCGFNDVDTGSSYTEIDYAFHIETRKFRIVEKGVVKKSWSSCSAGSVFKIQRISGVVTYSVDDVLQYASLAPSSGDVFLDCSLYHHMDEVVDATMFEIRRAEVDIEVSPLTAYAGVDDAIFANISIHPLSVTSRAHVTHKLEIELPKLTAIAHTTGIDVTATISLHPLSAQGSEALWVPEYNAAHIQTLPLQAGGTDIPYLNPVVDIEISPLAAKGLEVDENIAHADLLPLGIETHLGQSRYFSCYLPVPEVSIACVQGIYGDLPALTGMITARITGVTIQGDLPALAGEGLFLGATLVASMPSLEGTITAQVERKADIAATMPSLSGILHTGAYIASDMPSLSGTLTATVPVHADIAVNFRAFTGSMDVEVPTLADLNITLRAFSGTLEAHTDTSSRIAGTLPRLTGSMGVLAESGGDIEGSLPMLQGRMTGDRFVDNTLSATMPPLTGRLHGTVPRTIGVLRYAGISS